MEFAPSTCGFLLVQNCRWHGGYKSRKRGDNFNFSITLMLDAKCVDRYMMFMSYFMKLSQTVISSMHLVQSASFASVISSYITPDRSSAPPFYKYKCNKNVPYLEVVTYWGCENMGNPAHSWRIKGLIHNRILSNVCCDVFTCRKRNTCNSQYQYSIFYLRLPQGFVKPCL